MAATSKKDYELLHSELFHHPASSCKLGIAQLASYFDPTGLSARYHRHSPSYVLTIWACVKAANVKISIWDTVEFVKVPSSPGTGRCLAIGVKRQTGNTIRVVGFC
jgi:hypothetical protein